MVIAGATAGAAAQAGRNTCFGVVPTNAPATALRTAGVPFLRFADRDLAEGKSRELRLPSITASRLFLLGMTNSPDLCHPAWGGGDSFRNFFIGDSAGDIILSYASGRRDVIPLVFGYTITWRNNYGISSAPFSTDPAARSRLDAALCVLNGLDAYKTRDPLCLCIIPRPEPLASLTIVDNPGKVGYPVVDGLTIEAAVNAIPTNETLVALGELRLGTKVSAWLQSHAVKAAKPFPRDRRRAIEHLRRWLYTTPADLTFRKVREAAATVETTTNALPAIRFRGPVEAEILNQVYRENSAELLTRVDPDGMLHESNPKADNYNGFGGFTPGLGPFKDDYYTRNRAPIVLANWGRFAEASAALAFFDHWLMYFPESFPKLQMDGKPVPGHATVICNKPLVYFDSLRLGGWPTRYTTHDMGNPETDGHGFMMLSHYNAWIKAGRSADWVKEHWPALREAAEYIPWQLANPKLSFSEHGLLYAESEGGMNMISFYCNVPCWLGLLGFAEMAEAIGQTNSAARWRACADKLQTAMEAYFPKTIPPWGDVWDPDKTAQWGYPIPALAPVLFGLDYWGLDLRDRMPKGWIERCDRTWKMALAAMKPQWCAPKGFGYGQGYYTLSSLLLDQTADSDHIVDWTARMIFAPGQPHPFRVPEGVIIASDGSVWRRWGDLGNLYQMSCVLRAIQVMTGFDDLSPTELRLMPRIPVHWSGVSVEGQPVNALSEGRHQIVHLRLDYTRERSGRKFDVVLDPDRPLDRVRIRLGPAASGASKATLDGRPLPVETRNGGDARWVWLTLEHLPSGEHHITASLPAASRP